MFHPTRFQIHTSFMASIQKSFGHTLLIPTIIEKVALFRGYFNADLMIITSGFLLNSSKEEKKSLIPLTVRFLLYYGIPNIRCKKIFAGDDRRRQTQPKLIYFSEI